MHSCSLLQKVGRQRCTFLEGRVGVLTQGGANPKGEGKRKPRQQKTLSLSRPIHYLNIVGTCDAAGNGETITQELLHVLAAQALILTYHIGYQHESVAFHRWFGEVRVAEGGQQKSARCNVQPVTFHGLMPSRP